MLDAEMSREANDALTGPVAVDSGWERAGSARLAFFN